MAWPNDLPGDPHVETPLGGVKIGNDMVAFSLSVSDGKVRVNASRYISGPVLPKQERIELYKGMEEVSRAIADQFPDRERSFHFGRDGVTLTPLVGETPEALFTAVEGVVRGIIGERTQRDYPAAPEQIDVARRALIKYAGGPLNAQPQPPVTIEGTEYRRPARHIGLLPRPSGSPGTLDEFAAGVNRVLAEQGIAASAQVGNGGVFVDVAQHNVVQYRELGSALQASAPEVVGPGQQLPLPERKL